MTLIRAFELRSDLISVLIERWHLKTHTFHLSCEECTITLEDVALQLGLPVDKYAVTGSNKVLELTMLCYQLLGCSPNDGEAEFTSLKFS
ncbi:hypothetical protein PVK06_000423 [Gossypium arboreum]|uniref:Aminotransferase-like plant mobile domain-containing protein n=1 Tax=Gossypium arboreum TaxID=29729 RepID=A0ABR0QY83_GOSAR|nr:hypothetical protein PVK06_000423 [Gossypium arboreum]